MCMRVDRIFVYLDVVVYMLRTRTREFMYHVKYTHIYMYIQRRYLYICMYVQY